VRIQYQLRKGLVANGMRWLSCVASCPRNRNPILATRTGEKVGDEKGCMESAFALNLNFIAFTCWSNPTRDKSDSISFSTQENIERVLAWYFEENREKRIEKTKW
jgi:hypothetical protein